MKQQKGVFMTISSSLNAGVAGLASNANQLASISDNIANSSTYGYKRVETDFHSVVIGSSGGNYSAGGVRTSTQRHIDERGSLVATNNSTDLAVTGRGMIPVTTQSDVLSNEGDEQMLLTTTGSFRTDSDGYLTTESGLVLMGWPAAADGSIPTYPRDTSVGLEPVQINVSEFSGEPTTEITLGVNLPATATKFDSVTSGEVQQMQVDYFDNFSTSESIGISFTPTVPASGASNEWTMVLTDSAQSDAVIGEYVLTFDDTPEAGGDLASVTTVSGGTFDPVTGTMIVDVAAGPIEIELGIPGGNSAVTQLDTKFQPTGITKDGSAVGNITGVEVDANGMIYALYDTGVTQTLYQIPMVDVPNQNGLMAMDRQTYAVTPDSGAFLLWDAGTGPTGELVSYVREESTTDVAQELTTMIRTQRAYSSNAKVIQTVDEMLQETTNIKR